MIETKATINNRPASWYETLFVGLACVTIVPLVWLVVGIAILLLAIPVLLIGTPIAAFRAIFTR